MGIVLAGGRSLRFGSDKALAVLNGKPLIGHAVDLVRSTGLEVCVVTQKDRDYSFLNCPIFYDRKPHLGPLAGLDRAFEEFPRNRVLVLTCDMPFLAKEDLDGLLVHKEEDFGAVLYRLEKDRFQPFPGIYDCSLRSAAWISEERSYSMQAFIQRAKKVVEIDITTSREHFMNINQSTVALTDYDADHKRL